MTNIKDWVEIAKKYGAVFKNVNFEIDSSVGVRVVAVDKNRDFYIKIPKPVLIPREAIEIDKNHHYILDAFVKEKELRDMLNDYLNFILSDERVKKQKEFFYSFASLPQTLKDKLKTFGLIKILNINSMDNREVKDSLISSRTFNKKGEKVVCMPLMGFLNHNFIDGVNFDGASDDNAVIVKGKPSKSGEIFAKYNAGDSFHFLVGYYFPDKSPFAYSSALGLRLDDNKILQIKRQFTNLNKKFKGGVRIPKCEVEKGRIVVEFLWLGSNRTPRQPFWSFKKLWEDELGRDDTIEVFSRIKGFNIVRLTEILEEIDSIEKSIATDMIKEATFNQLKLIGSSFEDVRNIPLIKS